MMHLSFRRGLAYSLICVFLSACSVNRYRTPVGAFRDRVQQSTAVLADYYASRNAYEIDLYLTEIAADPDMEVLLTGPDGKPTPLGKPTFSPAAIRARLDALDLIGVYATRLASLANSEAPAHFHDAASLLGQNLGTLDKTFQSLQGEKDPTANQYVGPVARLIGAFGAIVLESKRDAAITNAIQQAAPEVNNILTLVKNDLDKAFQPLSVTGANQRLATLAVAYRQDRRKLNYEQRKARLAEIKDAALARSTDLTSAPSSVVTSLGAAHDALLRLAQSKRHPSDFSEFAASMDMWSSRIQYLAGQVRSIAK